MVAGLDISGVPDPLSIGAPRQFDTRVKGYDRRVAQRLLVYLDGVPLLDVVAFDVDRGFVTVIACDEDGRAYVDGDQVRFLQRYGNVVVRQKLF